MKLRVASSLALLSVAFVVAGCCPGSMMGTMPAPAPAPAVHKPVDTDGDGVADAKDKCPGTPKGVSVNADGCSAAQLAALAPKPADSDGDGVADAYDKCPNTPRGVSVNADGCSADQLAALAPKPVPPPPPAPSHVEQELVQKGVIHLENVYFETNSAKLTAESSTALDEAGAALAKYPQLKVEVGGHTDIRGAAATNLRLSKARAASVRQYLIDKFHLAPTQLTSKGYGESQAETKGTTAEELARDRRVVLKVLNPGSLPGNVEIQK